VLAIAVSVALPSRATDNWHPFAPHGWWAIGTAANILVWLFVGWEAVAQLAGDFRRPHVDLPRAVALAFGVVTVLYTGLAVATIGVSSGTGSRVPLADLIAVGFGRAGRDATAVLAVALTMGTMNVYIGGTSKLISSLANERALPRPLGADAHRSIPRRPLVLIGLAGLPLFVALLAGFASTDALVRATSACFIAVYVLALASGFRILDGRARVLAFVTLAFTVVLAAFSSWYLLVPAVAGTAAVALRRALRVAHDDPLALDPYDRAPGDFVVLTGLDPEPVEPAGTADAQRDHR
jgi:amino acid efflux transporter